MWYMKGEITMNKRQTKKFVKKKHRKKYCNILDPVNFNDPNTIKMILDELQSMVDGADGYDVSRWGTDDLGKVVTLLTEVDAELNVMRRSDIQEFLKTV